MGRSTIRQIGDGCSVVVPTVQGICCSIPPGPIETGEKHHGDAVSAIQSGALHAGTKDYELLTQKDVVGEQRPATSHRVAGYSGSDRSYTACWLD